MRIVRAKKGRIVLCNGEPFTGKVDPQPVAVVELVGHTVVDVEKIFRLMKPDALAVVCPIEAMFSYPRPAWVAAWTGAALVGRKATKWGWNVWQPILLYGQDPPAKRKMGWTPDAFFGGGDPLVAKKGDMYPEKPIQWLIRKLCPLGDMTIGQYRMGSGLVAEICFKMNHRYIGYEPDKKKFEAVVRRLKRCK